VKRAPIILNLNPDDVVRCGGTVKFTQAKFNVVGEETFIVSSTGNWLVTWDFSDVQHADLKKLPQIPYHLKWYPDNVIADDFTKDHKNEVVLTMPDDVRVHRFGKK